MEAERNGKHDVTAEPGEDFVDSLPKGKKGGKIKSRRNTAPASSQGYETIRTQLQKQRVAINQTIGHEVELKKGAKRLIRASSDLKSRETALLEAHYSDSKIQLLQQELASINNSLQAYQDESARDKQIPLIPVLMKTTSKISFVKPFTDFIEGHYYEDAGKFQEALYEFSEMRLTMCNPVKDQNGIDSMHEYYNQLYLVGKRFIASEDRQIIFVWYDAVNGIPAAQKSAAFEKSSVLFNIGALHTQCAARQSRKSEEDIDEVVLHLRKSAGLFEYIRDNFYKSPTLDMKKETLDFFIVLMKAQAEYLAWEKEIMRGLKDDVASLSHYSSLTNAVSLSYKDLKKTIEAEEYADYIPDSWAGLIKVQGAHLRALSHYYAAMVHMTIVKNMKKSENENAASNAATPSLPSDSELQEIIKKMYVENTDNMDEITTIKIANQASIAQSHLDAANLRHGDSVRYEKQSKPLQSMVFLHKFLSEQHERSLELMAEVAKLEKGPSVMTPVIRGLELEFKVVSPEFPAVKDLFAGLGPLPTFSALNNWEPPRCVKIKRSPTGYGFSVRGSKPVRISGVDKGSGAEAAGMKRDDYVLAVNENDALYMSHDDVVALVKQSQDWVTLTLSTPTGVSI